MSRQKSVLEREGWLEKRGHKRKNWKKRWHVLDPTAKTLEYFEERGGKPKGCVELSGARVLNESACQEQIGAENCFAVVAGDFTLYMREVDEKSRSEWIRFIGIVCKSGGGQAAREAPSPAGPAGPADDERRSPTRVQSVGAWTPGEALSHTAAFQLARARAHYGGARSGGGGGGGDDGIRDDTRLRNRVEKLLSPPAQSRFASRAKFEQSVVPWDMQQLPQCPTCSKKFAMLGPKRTNCRLCGCVVCDAESCSLPVDLNQIAKLLKLAVTPAGEVELRVCNSCKAQVERSGMKASSTDGGSKTTQYYRVIRDTKDKVDGTLKNMVLLTGYPRAKRLTPGESARLKELVAEVVRDIQMVKAAATKIAQLPESANGKRKRIAGNIVAATNTWAVHQSESLRLYSFGK